MLHRIVTIFFTLLCLPSMAQDTALMRAVLQRIASRQVTSDSRFSLGNFPSYITNEPSFSTQQPDNNIFFAALILFTLRKHYDRLLPSHRQIADSIFRASKDLYPQFRNKNERMTYNFWRTDTAFVFPYTKWIRRLKKNTALPDDMDDTVLSLLAQNADSFTAAEAHRIMQDYVNTRPKNKTIPKAYRRYAAYSVWYGKDFPPVFDICVLCNVLTFTRQYNLAWTSADSASLRVILAAVVNNDFVDRPLLVSPYYGSTALILYHLARLMSLGNIPELEAVKEKLLTAAATQYASTTGLLEKIILSSAFLQWGYVPPALDLSSYEHTLRAVESSDLPFFIGNIPSYFTPLPKRIFTEKGWLLFYHYCPAYNDALLLQYLLLRQHK